MKILAASDLHSEEEALETLEIIEKENNPDLTLILGDSAVDSVDYAERMLDITKPEKTLTINGNNENPELQEYFRKKGVSIDNEVRRIQEFTFIGFGSSPRGPFHTVNEKSESEIYNGLEKLFQKAKGGKTILVTHTPPFGVFDEERGMHIGSTSIKEIIEKYQPLLNFCGHVHKKEGVEMIGNTKVVKVASLMFKKAVLFDTQTIRPNFITARA